jgi:hypothetical protein
MQGMGLGAGLAALGFWIMVAAIVVGGIWYDIRKKEAQHQTLRRMIDSDQPIDEQMVNKLLGVIDGGSKQSQQEMKASLKIGGVILLFIAPGLALLGLFIGQALALFGVGALVLFIGLGLLKAADSLAGWYGRDDEKEAIDNPGD